MCPVLALQKLAWECNSQIRGVTSYIENDDGSQATCGRQWLLLLFVWQSVAGVIFGVIEASLTQVLNANPLEQLTTS